MNTTYFRFYAELNDFVPPEKRQRTVVYPFDGPVSVKHMIEAAGIPHTEVELILANGESVGFDYLVQDGDRISVYPAFATIDVSPVTQLRPSLPTPHRFILDNHLGRLARYMRLLGFDTLYFNDKADDPELAQIAYDENRILLTRDRGLLKRSLVTYGYCLRTKDSKAQLTAVLHRYQLHDQINPWTRCLRCNGRLHPVTKEAILHRLEPKTKLYFNEFQICRDCGQIYWRGSHFGKLEALIANAINDEDRTRSS
ncbi:MAG: Mut7-C ubiquitin/RNAse domain-containing protein [Ardenticatenaceae bacterium]|nr:Mut7-C ubiquitin/RNAse domain-containing protein [Ardenticatenaceae bacterium]